MITAPLANFWNLEGERSALYRVLNRVDRSESDPSLLNEIAEGDHVGSRPNRHRHQSDPTNDLIFHDTLRPSCALPVTRGGRDRGTPFNLLDAQGCQKVQLTLTVPEMAEFPFGNNGLLPDAGSGPPPGRK